MGVIFIRMDIFYHVGVLSGDIPIYLFAKKDVEKLSGMHSQFSLLRHPQTSTRGKSVTVFFRSNNIPRFGLGDEILILVWLVRR